MSRALTLAAATLAALAPAPRVETRKRPSGAEGAFGSEMPRMRYFGGKSGRRMARMLRMQEGRRP